MAYQLPDDLIRQVQLATRAESGLSHYDPTQNLSPLPAISETVASFDPSPPYLRCKNCKGRLLRGVQSVLCVYCGRPTDNLHDPICFKDSLAYGWLLESLQLDGSEIVGPLLERGGLDRVQSRPDEGTRLSELLDFKIYWPDDEQKRESNLSTENLQEVCLLKFSGFNLDNFLHESRRLNVSSKPEAHEVKSTDVSTLETKAVSSNNLSFFENVSSSELAVPSSEDKDNHGFSGWEADFQSANSGNQFDGSESFGLDVNSAVAPRNDEEISEQIDPLRGSPFDMSSHLDTVFGSAKDSKDANTRSDSLTSPSIGDFDSDDMWSNFNPKASLENKEPDPTITIKEALPQDNMSNIDISDQLESMFAPKKEKDGKEDSDLTSGPSVSDWTSDNLWNNISSETPQRSELPVSTSGLTNAVQLDNRNTPSTSLDWFQADQWEINPNEPANNAPSRDDASIGDWDEFTSSIPVQDFSNNAPKDNSLTASGGASDLFNSDNNLEEMDFGSFSQADPFQSPSTKEKVPTELNNIGVAEFDRAINWNSDTEGSLVQSNANAGVNSASTQTREDVEMLLSQMHDLSFMLEDKLSIPPKSDGFDSFPTK
ncbi:OLC1v1024802C1 [Oldenlandia corymbosa var. corymbosa]|uniref:OLC1v1024802C1 n=1 Tax=Oldenlandia corymbosa var. corymbosa TaxID=529605 RepID=A0AAV1C448_OLDCO|nr:OLC1v1024802C1 [Oldenlandia corymbosa var. corymbosa]